MGCCTPPDMAFVIITGTMVLAGGIVAFMFGYFLPTEYTEEEAAAADSTKEEPKQISRATQKSIVSGNIAHYSWLTSISMYRYKDMPNSLEFFCAGTILTPNKMFTGDSCIKEHFHKDDLKEAIVRSNSDFFWKDGYVHSVNKIYENPKLRRPYRNVYILEVAPDFPEQTKKPHLIAAPAVARESNQAGRFVVVGWGGEQDQTEQIHKNLPFSAYEWLSEKMVGCKNNLCHEANPKTSTCCNQAILTADPLVKIGPVSGKVLVNIRSGTPQILAIEMNHLFKGKATTEEDLQYFVDVGEPQFLEWIQQIAPSAVTRPNEKLIEGKTKHYLYSQWQTSHYIEDMEYFDKYNPLRKYLTLEKR